MARAPKKGSASKPARKPTPRAAKPSPKKPASRAAVPAAKGAKGRAPEAKKAAPAKASKPVARATRKPAPKTGRAKAPGAKPNAQPPKAAAPVKAAPPPKQVAPKPAPPPPPAKPAKPRKPEVTPKQIEKIKEGLIGQRATLIREATDLEEGAFNTSQSEMSGEASFDEEFADAGSFTFEREKELSISNNIRDLLAKVDHALDRIERGTYGLCENCGDPINKDRLLALPYSALCLRCKQAEERAR